MSSVLFSLWQLLLPGQSTLPLVLEEKDRLTKARHTGAGNTRYVPAHRSGPRGSGLLSPHTGRLLCARATSRALQHSGLPPPASAGTYPHGSRGIRWFRIERACVEFSNIRPCWGWHCGYRRLVFKLQLLLVLKISRPSSVICFNKKEYHIKVDLKKVFAMGFLFQKLYNFLMC